MSSDDKVVAIFIIAVAVALLVVAGCLTGYHIAEMQARVATEKAAIEAGLQQGTVQGREGVYWIKPDAVSEANGEEPEETPT